MEEPNSKPVLIREVWANNLESEFSLIRQLIGQYPFVSMDTEFPGVIFSQHVLTKTYQHQNLHPLDEYRLLKANVDELNLIQVGLTLSDARGKLPDLGTNNCFIWQFNFCDFDVVRDKHAPDSIALLRRQGIDFERNVVDGVDSARFAAMMLSSGLLYNKAVTWVTFHSAHDFGYLVKILTQRKLPTRLDEFLWTVRRIFGNKVYDIKHMIRYCDSLYGGLNRVAETLKVYRVVGKCHQAGSDSLLTWYVFQKIRDTYFVKGGHKKCSRVLFGLELYAFHQKVVNRGGKNRFYPQMNFNYNILNPQIITLRKALF
ncbi:hypothetical protein TanjilG_03149 [Lupinus angustifolius]|uniref:poly(A)-specific ribonuclease n=1 Tax=Lupinus angustifolius TaxID=3871 RepID=A0A4P1RD81_LUPAN|nr:PREDICTED: probable CCR4-associated factor 1 homolog 9 [Lupinus angustifolius]OIW08473.1 hypothetical protein TanjilG_03149 [Lupinus angustifolius]